MACIGPWGDASKQTGHEVCATIVKLAGAGVMNSTVYDKLSSHTHLLPWTLITPNWFILSVYRLAHLERLAAIIYEP